MIRRAGFDLGSRKRRWDTPQDLESFSPRYPAVPAFVVSHDSLLTVFGVQPSGCKLKLETPSEP